MGIKNKILIIIIILGLCFYDIAYIFSTEKIYSEKCKINLIGEIISIKEECEYNNKYIVKTIYNNKIDYSKNTKMIIYVDKEIEFFPGDVVNISGNFQKADISRNYKGYNYRKFLKQSKIYGIIDVDKIDLIQKRKDFYSIIGKIKSKLYNSIDNLYKEEYSNFLKGILLGNSSSLSEEIKENFRDSSISHILAISGMHVSYVIIGVKFILEKIVISKRKQNYILIIILFSFLILTGFSVSCIRACIMSSLMLLSSNLYRKNNFYISLVISFFIIIILNPYNVFNCGMWLSYMGTLGIVLFYKFFYRVIEIRLLKKLYYKNNIQNNKDNYVCYRKNIFTVLIKFLSYIIKLFIISCSAQILIIPIMIYVFNTYSLSFFISNILVSFFIGPILAIGYISIFISYVYFPFSKILSNIEMLLIFYVFKIAEICSKIPFSKIRVTTPSFIEIIFYYVFIIVIILIYRRRKFYYSKLVLDFQFSVKEFNEIIKKLEKMINKNIKFLIIIIIVVIISFQLIRVFTYSQLKIYFIDVGQGDCTLIITPKGKNILIDGGEGNSEKYDYGKNVVVPYLLDRKIKKIDYLIVSHADSDHIRTDFLAL